MIRRTGKGRARYGRASGSLVRAACAGLAMAALPAGLSGQDPPPADTAAGEPTELVFEREVFDYPTYERRNPFRPLTSTESGPRFEQIRLRGIIYSPDPRRSVALLATAAPGADPASSQTRRIRVGESWGNVRVLEIQRDQILVEVEEFGLTERRVMQLERRRGQGGS